MWRHDECEVELVVCTLELLRIDEAVAEAGQRLDAVRLDLERLLEQLDRAAAIAVGDLVRLREDLVVRVARTDADVDAGPRPDRRLRRARRARPLAVLGWQRIGLGHERVELGRERLAGGMIRL